MPTQLKTWRLIKRDFPTASIVHNSRQRWERISRVYLQIWDHEGHSGVGEASPLSGYSPDTAESCHRELTRFLPALTDKTFCNAGDIESATTTFPAAFPAARFALESALLDLLATAQAVPLWQLFTSEAAPLRINALLDTAHLQVEADHLFNQGIRVFKIKVGAPDNLHKELEQLQFLRQKFGDSIEIRLDANGAFSPDTLVQTLHAFAPFAPSFIEEPVPFSMSYPRQLPIPFAADESLLNTAHHLPILSHPSCSTLVLKPSLQGGFFSVRRLADRARAAGKQFVITHMFESLPGFLAAAHLAISLHPQSACGLYPHSSLDASFPEKYILQHGEYLQLNPLAGLGLDKNDLRPSVDGASS